jgi:hypothetical protein
MDLASLRTQIDTSVPLAKVQVRHSSTEELHADAVEIEGL